MTEAVIRELAVTIANLQVENAQLRAENAILRERGVTNADNDARIENSGD